MPLERTPTLTVNGISGVTGKYAVDPLSTADLAGRLRRSRDSAGISALRTDRGRRLKTRAFPALLRHRKSAILRRCPSRHFCPPRSCRFRQIGPRCSLR